MSTNSLPSYAAPAFFQTPSYSAEPQQSEHRIALADRFHPRPNGDFVKKSKNGDARLRLTAQENNGALPTYGTQGRIQGVVELAKTDNVFRVEVKIEGRLWLREIAEGGTTYVKSCLATDVLWEKDSMSTALPPTFDVKLSGVPGFTATIDVRFPKLWRV
ncbi:hypothetical protein C0991_005901 [Blastosporella zonata]|nr:hypothetical protein C0991_005901 [Blastosporella zonata]